MNRILTIVIFIIFGMGTVAQKKVYTLHPAVGDTIDKIEMNKYYLFDGYTKDSIDHFILYQNRDLYYLVGVSEGADVFNAELDIDEIVLQKERIEKLYTYYASKLKKDSVEFNASDNLTHRSDSSNINFNILTPKFMKSVKKGNRRKFWEEHRTEIKKIREKVPYY